MTAPQKDWVDIISALLVPTLAIAGVIIAFLQWRTNELKRKQELFDRRYAFYQKIRKNYFDYAVSEENYDKTDFFDLAEEALFLFGSEIEKHIVDIVDHEIPEQVMYGIMDDWFVRPFKKYLELK